MARHSKNSTTRPFFTYHERKELKYGTQKQRLGTESQRPFDACCLCLKPSNNPVITLYGYIYCKECILQNILDQKKQIKRAKKQYEEQLKRQQEEKKLEQLREQQKQIQQFQKIADGISNSSENQHGNNNNNKNNGAFWVPSAIPTANKMNNHIQKPDEKIYDPMCHKFIHSKELIQLEFRRIEEKEGRDESNDLIEYNSRFMCGCCLKTLTNATNEAYCIVECGHVVCGVCYRSFIQQVLKNKKEMLANVSSSSNDINIKEKATNAQCLECGKKILRNPIAIQIAGTGFTQEGKSNETTKYTPSLGFA